MSNSLSKDEPLAAFDPVALACHGLITTGFHLPYDPKLTECARELRRNMTPAEKKLWYQYLSRFPFRVLRQRPIDHYIVDFYCRALHLVIEIDGESHFTDDGKMYDEYRTSILNAYGLTVMRFTNREVMNNIEGVCEQIASLIASDGKRQVSR